MNNTDITKVRKFREYFKQGVSFFTEPSFFPKIIFVLLLAVKSSFWIYAWRVADAINSLPSPVEPGTIDNYNQYFQEYYNEILREVNNLAASADFLNMYSGLWISSILSVFLLGLYSIFYLASVRNASDIASSKKIGAKDALRLYKVSFIGILGASLIFGALSYFLSSFLIIPYFIIFFAYVFYFCRSAEVSASPKVNVAESWKMTSGIRIKMTMYGILVVLIIYSITFILSILMSVAVSYINPSTDITGIIMIGLMIIAGAIKDICIMRMYVSIYNDVSFAEPKKDIGEENEQ